MLDEKLTEEKMTELEKSRQWTPRVISRLEALLRLPDDFALYRVNPLSFAAEKGITDQEAVDLFLHATKLGIFRMNWLILCTSCGDVVESFGNLRAMHSHFRCSMCHADNEASLDDMIQITFTVSPALRDIPYNRPETLPIEDFFFKHHFSQDAVMPDGSRAVDTMKLMAKVSAYLEPGEKKRFPLDLSKGALTGYDALNKTEFYIKIAGAGSAGKKLSFELTENGYSRPEGEVSEGKFELEFSNSTLKKGAVVLFYMPEGMGKTPAIFRPYLSGKRLLTSQTFRDLFRSETIFGNEGLAVKDIVILFTDLKSSTALYDQIGDLKAFSLVQQHFDRLGKVIQANSGSVVKTIGDAVMASFANPEDAVTAALRMLEEIESFNKEYGSRVLILKIGIHRGPLIVVTLNDKLDYFGQTVNLAARIQKLADSEEIFLSREVYSDAAVSGLLKGFDVIPQHVQLKGILEKVQVLKVAAKA